MQTYLMKKENVDYYTTHWYITIVNNGIGIVNMIKGVVTIGQNEEFGLPGLFLWKYMVSKYIGVGTLSL